MSAVILFLGGLCWVSSLWFPAFYTDTNTLMGYWVLISGWLGIITFQFGWFANLLIFLAVLWMYKYPIRATLVAAAAVLVATQAFWFVVMPGENENTNIIGQGLGFWLWYGSLIIICIGVIFGSDTEAPVKDMAEFKVPPAASRPNAPYINEQPSTATDATLAKTATAPSSLDAPLIAANDDTTTVKPITPRHLDEPTPLADLLDNPPPTRRS
ncbi:hypothetical protein [Thiofilum flexile]|uniref:hypothetical protein n=1 Tax=Thiofilum flexile TaxID=125627 RepID=UPI0013A5886C|nr:hypothetical protein [Thiofilum flexile]